MHKKFSFYRLRLWETTCRAPLVRDQFTMNSSPPEICHKIFADACLDGGSTGRSLSLVSKYIHETSKPTRFQSVALHGFVQITAFADILERTPSHLRRVRHLFISTRDPTPTNTSSYACSIRVEEMPPWRPWPGLDEYGRNPYETKRLIKHETNISAAIERVLLHIAPTVQIVAMFVTYEWRSVLLPLPLPNLTELIIRGSYDMPPTDAPLILFPSLRYLHIGERRHISAGYLRCISKAAPSLTHLRFTGCNSADNLDAISPSVKNVLVQIPPPPRPSSWSTDYLGHIQRLQRHIMDQSDGRLILLKAPKSQETDEEVLQQWLKRINGGQGCWIDGGPQVQTEIIQYHRESYVYNG